MLSCFLLATYCSTSMLLRVLYYGVRMGTRSRIRDVCNSAFVLIPALWKQICLKFQKKEELRYCALCVANKRSLAKVFYLIRTGERKGCTDDVAESFGEILVCSQHHPDKDVAGADLSHETQDYLRYHHVAAACVYHYRVPEHLFRLG